jgi:hypothetical protein
VPAKLYLDDDVQVALAQLLRSRGVDALSSAEVGMLGRADEDHLRFATAQGRALLSYNFHDYLPLARQWYEGGQSRSGVILSFRQFSRAQLGEAVRLVLRLLAAIEADKLENTIRFLDEFRHQAPVQAQ